MFENFIYWTDSTRQGVLKTDLYNNSQTVETIYRDRSLLKEPKAIKAYHYLRQPVGKYRISGYLIALMSAFGYVDEKILQSLFVIQLFTLKKLSCNDFKKKLF